MTHVCNIVRLYFQSLCIEQKNLLQLLRFAHINIIRINLKPRGAFKFEEWPVYTYHPFTAIRFDHSMFFFDAIKQLFTRPLSIGVLFHSSECFLICIGLSRIILYIFFPFHILLKHERLLFIRTINRYFINKYIYEYIPYAFFLPL